MSYKWVSGFSKFSHKVNAEFERKAELLTGGRHRQESLNSSRQSIFGEGGDVGLGEGGTRGTGFCGGRGKFGRVSR